MGYLCNCELGILQETAGLIREKDDIKAVDPTNQAIAVLNQNIENIIAENKRAIWRDKTKSSGSRPDCYKLWSLLRGLFGKKTFPLPTQPILFGSATHSNPAIIEEVYQQAICASSQIRSTKEVCPLSALEVSPL